MATNPLPHAASWVDMLPPREAIATAIETLVAVLDVMDGDADVEADGDDLDGTGAEDEPLLHGPLAAKDGYPGCPISDPGGCNVEDGGELEDEDGSEPLLATPARYDIDQTKGPINEVEAYRAHMLEQLKP